MTNCKFDPNLCDVSCKKYSICSYYSIQNQVSNIQSQLNFIYDTISKILQSNEAADLKLNLLESAVFKYLTDSETMAKNKFKESNNEKENQ
jgi:hypothetical protein